MDASYTMRPVILKGQSHRDRKQVSGCRGLVGTEGLTAEGHEERFG